jgi:hypothetical protein
MLQKPLRWYIEAAFRVRSHIYNPPDSPDFYVAVSLWKRQKKAEIERNGKAESP